MISSVPVLVCPWLKSPCGLSMALKVQSQMMFLKVPIVSIKTSVS